MTGGRGLAVLGALAMGWVVPAGTSPVRFSFKGWISAPKGAGKAFTRDTTVVLDGGAHVGFLSSDLKFEFHDLPSASYTLQVHNPNFEFPMLRVDVSPKFTGDVKVSQPDMVTGQPLRRLPYDLDHGLNLKAINTMNYFEKREAWSAWSIVMNPMFLMMLFPMGMMYLMPKMMEGMDEEEKKEFLKQQSSMQPQGQMPDFAGWLAGASADKTKGKKKKTT